MSARAKAVLPAPRSPESVTISPRCSELAMSIASRCVACSPGSATVKVDMPGAVRGSAMTWPLIAGWSASCGGQALACGRVWQGGARWKPHPGRSLPHQRGGSSGTSLCGLVEREDAGDRGAADRKRFQRHRATVQFHEGADQGKAEASPAVT